MPELCDWCFFIWHILCVDMINSGSRWIFWCAWNYYYQMHFEEGSWGIWIHLAPFDRAQSQTTNWTNKDSNRLSINQNRRLAWRAWCENQQISEICGTNVIYSDYLWVEQWGSTNQMMKNSRILTWSFDLYIYRGLCSMDNNNNHDVSIITRCCFGSWATVWVRPHILSLDYNCHQQFIV